MARICHEHCPPEGSILAAVLAVVAAAIVISAAGRCPVIALLAVLIGASAITAASAAVLVHILRRDGLGLVAGTTPRPARVRQALPAARPAALSAPQPLAIEAPMVRLAGVDVGNRGTAQVPADRRR
jgi:hypothetical protein